MPLYDIFLGGLETKKSNSIYHDLGKIVLGNLNVYEQIEAGYYDGSIVGNNTAIYCAARGGHKDLVEYFISKGADNWNYGMRGAAEGGHKELEEWFKQKINI
jgi:hypothetical protein